MPGQGIQVGEYKSEIARYEERLNSIRHEVDSIMELKRTTHIETTEAIKNANFLAGENSKKDAELVRKQETIRSLDAEITAKQSQFDILQGEVGKANKELESARSEKEIIEKEIAAHTTTMRDEHEKLNDRRKITEENHRISDEKLKKIQDLIKSLN